MATKVLAFGALEFICGQAVRTSPQLEVERAEQLLDEGVRVLAVQEVVALVPTALVGDHGALLHEVEEQVGRPAEVLLSMCVVALGPLVLLVDVGAETCFVGVDHEFFCVHLLFVQLQVLRKPLIAH